MRTSLLLSALCALLLSLTALPAVSADSTNVTNGPQAPGLDSKWLAPEKDRLLNLPGALPFYPHRANTTDNHLLPKDAFESVEDVCTACHQDIYAQWRSSIMSRSWDDPIYRALLKQVSEATEGKLDYFCTGCHSPFGLTTGQITPDLNRLPIEKAAAEHPLPGVDCEGCHNYSSRTGQDNGAYVLTPMLNGKPTKFGPYKDAVSPYHETVYSELHTRSDFCSVCHNVTHPLTSTAIERTYDEWHESQYAFNDKQCQSCHMPDVAGKAAIMGPDRPNVATHYFNGGNVALLNYFGEKENAQRSRNLLKSAGTIEFVDLPVFAAGSDATVKIKVSNKGAGHKLPTGFPEGRQMWIDFTVTDAKGAVVYRLGAIKDGKTEPGTEDFKVHLGDKDGHEIDTEIWLLKSIISDTRVLPDGYDIRTFHIPVPLKAEGPFKLEAKLNYWPFSQALADELLGAGKMPIEIVTIASTDTNVPVTKAAAIAQEAHQAKSRR
jgi:Cytochrome c554 and c-prime